MKCIKCQVTGRVQGVFYRASTRDMARSLGITGHAINLANGDVEVYACGTEHSVDALESWLWEGPPHAQVTGVVCESTTLTGSPPGRFDVG